MTETALAIAIVTERLELGGRIPGRNIVRAWRLPGARGRGADRTPPRRRCCCRG